jgi:hypothetical protein
MLQLKGDSIEWSVYNLVTIHACVFLKILAEKQNIHYIAYANWNGE